jgi:hypothetical protein
LTIFRNRAARFADPVRVARDRREGQVGLEHLVGAFRNSFAVLERAEGWIRVEHGGHLREKAAGAW